MTRTEARMVAEELHRKMKAENPFLGEELLSADHLCKRLDVSRRWLSSRAKQLPRILIGGTYRYPFSRVLQILPTIH